MSIRITCPECYLRFSVEEQFAGRAGRCPDCDAVIQVPELHDEADEEYDRLARRRSRDEDRSYDAFDEPNRQPKYDPIARAERWKKVHSGLWSINIAIILYLFSQLINVIFTLAKGFDHARQANLDSGDIAIGVLGLLAFLVSSIFWIGGRSRLCNVPLRSAQGSAKAALITGWLGVIGIVVALLSLIGFVAVIANKGPAAPAAGGLILLVLFSGFPGTICMVVSEYANLFTLMRIGAGLKSTAAESSSRFAMYWYSFILGLGFLGMCVLFAMSVEKQQKLQNKANGQFKQQGLFPKVQDKNKPLMQNPDLPPGKPGNPVPVEVDEDADNPNNPNNPLDLDPEEEKRQTFASFIFVGIFSSYLVFYMIANAKSRRAIKEEIQRLLPESHDHDHDRHH